MIFKTIFIFWFGTPNQHSRCYYCAQRNPPTANFNKCYTSKYDNSSFLRKVIRLNKLAFLLPTQFYPPRLIINNFTHTHQNFKKIYLSVIQKYFKQKFMQQKTIIRVVNLAHKCIQESDPIKIYRIDMIFIHPQIIFVILYANDDTKKT